MCSSSSFLSRSTYFSLNEPSANDISGQSSGTLEEQVTLSAVDADRVPVTLPTGFHRRCLPNIRHLVDLKHMAILPSDIEGHHNAIGPKFCGHIHIYFYIIHSIPLPKSSL